MFIDPGGKQCDRQLESFLASLPTRIVEAPSERATAVVTQKVKKERKTKKPSRNEPTVNLKAELKRICGVDLTSIDGFNVITAQTIISEVGTDMWIPTENHFASWLGLTPSHDVSGGRIVGSGKRKVQNRVAMALRMAATTLLNSKSCLGVRERWVMRRTAVINQIRGLLLERGITLPKGRSHLEEGLPEILAESHTRLSGSIFVLLAQLRIELDQLSTRIEEMDALIAPTSKENDACQRLT